MILTSLLTLVLASFTGTASAQNIVYDSIHNVTALSGTWSSGSKAVLTGSGFANPANMSFTYPATTGISYSFTDDGFYEISRYRFNSNGSEPTCITGVMAWVHGTYTLNPNGSITTIPFGDGYQQIQDPCAATSNFIETYNLTEYYQQWRIFLDPDSGPHLHLFRFDGAPLAPQFQISTSPNMLPTRLLRNVTTASPPSRRSLSSADSLLGPQWTLGVATAAAVVLMAASTML
ncbi:hypothetical protein BYT27DRAFT_7075475 [Phlegmacium glaucopus]|nr:hypothetical protein BYT27DRAFT_7075475 [Phlegmacium glaucopus]